MNGIDLPQRQRRVGAWGSGLSDSVDASVRIPSEYMLIEVPL